MAWLLLLNHWHCDYKHRLLNDSVDVIDSNGESFPNQHIDDPSCILPKLFDVQKPRQPKYSRQFWNLAA